MEIQSVRFTVETNDHVEITFEDTYIFNQPYNEVRYQYTDKLNAWEEVPNTIEPYDHLYGQSLEQVQAQKYGEVWSQYQTLVDETAQTGISGRDTQKQKKLNDNSNKRLTKKSNGQSLTAQEEADEDWFDAYNDWADDNHDAADSACNAIELMTDKYAVSYYDVVNTPGWTDFVAP